MSNEDIRPPIKSGWRGDLNGAVESMKNSTVRVDSIAVTLDYDAAWALCNVLTDKSLTEHPYIENHQRKALSNLGAALGRLIDHKSANNGGREILT